MSVETPKQEVIVTDIRMRFISMVVFMIKWAIASIPALLILLIIGALTWSLIIGILTSIALGPKHTPVSSMNPAAEKSTQIAAANLETSAYLDRVIITSFRVGKSTLDEPGVFGEIKNTGDRTLREVEITIYYLGQNNEPVFEKTYRPVLVSDYSFGDANTPLKPGYSRKFGVKLDDAPSEWAGKVDVKVTSIAFYAGD